MGEEKRQEMMQNLFGESDEEVESEQEAIRHSSYLSDEEGEGEVEGEGQAEIEGEGEAEAESEGERAYSEPEKEESEGERYRSSPEREISDQRMESDGKEAESDAEEYDRREATSKRQSISPSVSERSADHNGLEDGDEEVEQVREPSEQGDDDNVAHPAANMHDVFGESDDEEQPDYAGQHSPEPSADRAPSEDEGSEQRGLHPEHMVPDEEQQYESDEEQQFDQKQKEKPVGPPLSLEIPLRPPPGQPEKMNIVRVSNIMEVDTKPFDPKTYVEEDVFVTDETGGRKRIRLEDNVVRWREVPNRDGTVTRESNARFVRWSDGSLQLLIGNEVLDISVQNARHDHVHLFLRHDKGILQSQGRLQHKMRFMPSSLSSKSHKMLTALVDSRHKKQYKVKNVITNTDPEREKEEKEKALEQRIRSREDLHRKQEKISRKYAPVREREREPQLSPGYLEEALEEDDEEGYAENRRAVHARRFQEELEAEGRAERRIINAKKHQPPAREQLPKYSKDRRPIRPSRREAEEAMSDESEREVSEYESEGIEDEEENIQEDLEEQEAEEEPEEPEEEGQEAQEYERGESEEEERAGDKRRRQEREESPMEESPPRKSAQRRRVVVSSESDED